MAEHLGPFFHTFHAELDGIGCTMTAEDAPEPAPRSESFTATFPLDPEGREVEFVHIGTWDHEPSEVEVMTAKAAHGFGTEDFNDG